MQLLIVVAAAIARDLRRRSILHALCSDACRSLARINPDTHICFRFQLHIGWTTSCCSRSIADCWHVLHSGS